LINVARLDRVDQEIISLDRGGGGPTAELCRGGRHRVIPRGPVYLREIERERPVTGLQHDPAGPLILQLAGFLEEGLLAARGALE
jgi:hypothetical protein